VPAVKDHPTGSMPGSGTPFRYARDIMPRYTDVFGSTSFRGPVAVPPFALGTLYRKSVSMVVVSVTVILLSGGPMSMGSRLETVRMG